MTAKPPTGSRPESRWTIQELVTKWRASVVRGTLPASGVTPAAVQQVLDDLDSALSSASVPASGWAPMTTADGRVPRPETGPMQFGDDWPGVFLRGDCAGPMGFFLTMLVTWAAQHGYNPIVVRQLQGFARILESCDVRLKPEVQTAALVAPPAPAED